MQEKVAVVIVLLSFMASLYLIVAAGFNGRNRSAFKPNLSLDQIVGINSLLHEYFLHSVRSSFNRFAPKKPAHQVDVMSTEEMNGR